MKGVKEKIKKLFVEKRDKVPPLDDEPFPTKEEIRQTKESEEDFADGNFKEIDDIVW